MRSFTGSEAFSIMAATGLIAAYIVAVIIAYLHKFYIKDLNTSLLISIFPVFLCGKILYLIASTSMENVIDVFLGGGFVFYGGLIGLLIGVYISSKLLKFNTIDMLNCISIPILVAQALGRIGCTINGCCYGISCSGIFYIINQGNRVFPVQILESIICVTFAILLVFIQYENRFFYYCIMYGTARYLIEILRGDQIRGHLGVLSTSQWISIIFVIYGITMLALKRKHLNLINK